MTASSAGGKACMAARTPKERSAFARMGAHARLAAGSYRKWSNLRSLCVGFDNDVFTQIQAQAEKNHCSVTEQVRTYVEWGMESEKKEIAL